MTETKYFIIFPFSFTTYYSQLRKPINKAIIMLQSYRKVEGHLQYDSVQFSILFYAGSSIIGPQIFFDERD